MLDWTEMRTMVSGEKIRAQLQNGAVEMLALLLRHVQVSHPFSKWDKVYCSFGIYSSMKISFYKQHTQAGRVCLLEIANHAE